VLKLSSSFSLNTSQTPPVTGALGVIGFCGRANQGGDDIRAKQIKIDLDFLILKKEVK